MPLDAKKLALASLLMLAGILQAQQPDLTTKPSPTPDAEKPRIYVTDSDSWQIQGGGGGSRGSFGGSTSGGASPQTAEIIKTFGQRCPGVIVNNRLDVADYIITLQHEGGKGLLRKKDKVAVFVHKSGDSIFSESTLSLGGSVQDSCTAIAAHWTAHAKELAAMAPPPTPGQVQVQVVAPAAAVEKAKLNISSTPAGADIEINGDFVGNTPSIVEVDPGKSEVKITRKGFAVWSKTVSVKGGTITLIAELTAE